MDSTKEPRPAPERRDVERPDEDPFTRLRPTADSALCDRIRRTEREIQEARRPC